MSISVEAAQKEIIEALEVELRSLLAICEYQESWYAICKDVCPKALALVGYDPILRMSQRIRQLEQAIDQVWATAIAEPNPEGREFAIELCKKGLKEEVTNGQH